MKQYFFYLIIFLFLQLSVAAQYEVSASGPNCGLPECQSTTSDSTRIPKKLGSINQEKSAMTAEEGIKQKVYQIESLNAVIFIPEAFIPLESAFNISGAISYIDKIQIYTIEEEELVFQTSTPENSWNGKWKEKPQYGFFKYIITIKLDDNKVETIEGIVETKNPI